MKFGADDVRQHAASLGFRPDSLEKVFRLLGLLETMRSNAFLRPRVALKGGTALNLFLFDLPRLSVDIDLNYVGTPDRDAMLAEKPKVEQAIQAVCAREGLTVKRVPTEHAGGKWRLTFTNTAGSADKLEVEVNFMLRTPLWPVNVADSKVLGPADAKQIAVLELHELAAGKLAALCARNASRDIFDAHALLRRPELDRTKLRIAFVVYGGMNRKDWRQVRVEDIGADPRELERELVPMLRADLAPDRGDIDTWTSRLVGECRDSMAAVLPLAKNELEFLERLNGTGEIAADLLTDDAQLRELIANHPGLKWKALNVQRRLQGAPAPEDA